MDEDCIYVHDPDVDEKLQDTLDCQHVPIARERFAKMSTFGIDRLRTAVILRKTRVINLCDTAIYLSRDYYCSLLAEARQHKVLPSVNTINQQAISNHPVRCPVYPGNNGH